MKKLTIFILAALFISGLFATPKIPKQLNYDDTDPYLYVSNDCQNIYIIKTIVNTKTKTPKYSLSFINRSLVIDTQISIQINFENEEQLDSFTQNIDLLNLDIEFDNLRKRIVKMNITPIISSKTDKPHEITEDDLKNHPFGYGYDKDYDFQNIPSGISYILYYKK